MWLNFGKTFIKNWLNLIQTFVKHQLNYNLAKLLKIKIWLNIGETKINKLIKNKK